MNIKNEVEECCVQLESHKVTDRKKFCDRLTNLLEKEEVITLLNRNNSVTWMQVISAVQECLRKDAEKCIEDAKKKGSLNIKYPSGELLLQVVKLGAKEASDLINVSRIVGYIIGCMKDSKMKKCYDKTFLLVLKENILLNSNCRGRLDSDDWTVLFKFLKTMCEGKCLEALGLKCFMLLVKWGPTSGLLPSVLREEFNFITKLCQSVSQNSPTNQQEDVLDIALDFCRHTAKDNRASCCKLGEDVFSNFIELYEFNGREAKIKNQLVEFFLLQISIHHPNGVNEGHPCAYAISWASWKRCLKLMYSLLIKEIGFYFKYHHKNSSFFITNGESTILLDTFSTLLVEVSHQVIKCTDLDLTTILDYSLTSQAAPKRQKIEISLESYINNIRETKSWLWIHIVCSIIKAYPALLQSEDYLILLQILSTIQIESNDHNVINNIYMCLSVMLDIQNTAHTDTQLELDKLWKIIGETTLKTFGLNQHKQATETLLQKLIPKGIIELETVLQTYTSGVLNISTESITTMETTLQYLNYAKLDNSRKEMLISSILNSQNMRDFNYLLHPGTANFLFNLTLKQWPMDNNRNQREEPEKSNIYCDIVDIYFKTILEQNILPAKKTDVKDTSDTNSTMEPAVVETLINIIQNVVENVDFHSVEKLLSMVVLLINITNCMVKSNTLIELDLNNFATVRIIDRILNYNTIKKLDFYKNKTDRESKHLLQCVNILDTIFTFNRNNNLTSALKALIPLELLRSLVGILNDLQEDEKISNIKFDLKKAITKALSSFSCISDKSLNQNQQHILEVMAAPNYDVSLENDYILLLTFLNTLKYSKPGIIPDSVMKNILTSIEEICIARYHCTENAVEILNVLTDLYPHVAAVKDGNIKTKSVALLKPFYENRDQYGPTVSIAVLNCIGQLYQVKPENNFSQWSDDDIIKFVPDFLCSDYQEIRFKAIETLIIFFQVMSVSKQLQDFHRQEEIFAKMYHKSLEVFDVTGEITVERRIDEILSRTASVLHTFTSIILCCSSWIEECLLALVKLTYKKNLGSVNKSLEIINQHFCGRGKTNCIETYLEHILERWLNEHQSIDNFPFKLFLCENKFDFYLKYIDICIPLLISADRGAIISTAKRLSLSEKDIVEKTCPKIFGRALCTGIENMGDILTKDQSLCYYVSVVGLDGFKICLIDNIDQLLLCMLNFLTDDKYIYDSFEETVIFSSKYLSIEQFNSCLNFVESFLCDGASIVSFLSENGLNKLEKILLALKLNMYNVFTTDNKLKSFHRYIVWMNIVLSSLRSSSNFHCFFIRDTIYTLINLIENHKENRKIVSGICKLLYLFLRKVLPKYSETFQKFLTFTVNSLKNYAIQIDSINEICIEILHFLIVENACHLMNEIEKLDNFPQLPKFDTIRKVHHKIKYGSGEASLEDEIRFFLQHKDFSTRQDSLLHLRNILCKEKVQLKNLYNKLQDIRGFSEDCEESLLHRLICMLAKMSYSTSENVRLEAIKCLGELGPANLMTLVLKPEKGVSDIKATPFELLSGHVVSLLSEYIIDPDVTLVQAASEVFYIVLDSKEGRKVAESNMDFGYGQIDKKYISPYFPVNRSSSTSNITLLTEIFATKVNDSQLWCPKDKTCHSEWIVKLVTSLLETFSDKSYLPRLIPICKITPKLCEHLLPLIINLLLYISNKKINDILSKNIGIFFTNHWNFTVPKYTAVKSITVNKKSVKSMLNVVSFVLLQKSYAKSRGRSFGELDLNYLQTAKAAEFCAAHFTALLYSELWCQARIQEIETRDQNREYLIGSTMLDVIFENEQNEVGEALQNILRNAYKAIGDLDALPGCGISFLLKSQFRVEHYKELGKWNQVTHFYEMQVSHGLEGAKEDLLESLKKCSLYQLPLLCTDQKDDFQYECLWRLGQWSPQAIDKKQTITYDTSLNPAEYEKYRFYALKALHDSNEFAFVNCKKSHSMCIIEHLRHTSLESSQNIYPILSQLQALNEMEDFANATKSRNFTDILKKWNLQDDIIRKNNFDYVEPVIAQRIVMLSDYLRLHNDDSLKDYLVNMLLDFAELAKEEGYFQVASSSIANLQFMSDLNTDVETKIQLMDAQISWSINNKLVAHHILNKLCKSENINPKLQSAALKLSGEYKSETFSENRKIIIADYFLKSIIKVSDRKSEEYQNILDTYDKVAQFADKGYQQIMTYMNSDLFQRKKVNMTKSKQTASNIQKQSKKTRDECQAAVIHDKQSNIDEIEINTTEQERDHFLKLALSYYLLNLMHTDKNNIRIFRIMALFFENKRNSIISNIVKDILPSYKYIAMLPQLIPHIADNATDLYNKKVNEIVEKCAIDHPHHTLPLLLSLANSNKDREFSDPKTKTSSNDARVATANNLIRKLKRKAELNEYINKLQQLSQALIDLAYYKETSTNERKKEFTIPRSQKIMKIQNFDDVLLPTYNLPISRSSNYSQIVGITSFGTVYHPVGGINAPKKITCTGTDGKKRSQLLKGQDDLRQDAVMQQVFTIMNNLLSTNKQTRNLLIRTYKIVPLSMRSGILEWVDNSVPIGDYLVGDKEKPGAHQVYRPSDKSPSVCREMLKKSAGKSAEQKLATYKAICKDFKPVFHKFFESKFPHSTIWYERRRAYIHSVATTSMCGYILGIGDRHVSNIMIDETTAEVIHIDFGIAFEQGRVLPTPETVPFRLTRDIVDGMGVSGVEGIFRRSCEKTMQVLRQNSQTIITILEVLLYDPLYVWTVTSAEANKRQTDDENALRNLLEAEEENITVNITAERALLRLREKLQGTELGNPTSIEHQVGTLIQQAVDPANLCKLYCGWQAYL